jgi:hypothetical protein
MQCNMHRLLQADMHIIWLHRWLAIYHCQTAGTCCTMRGEVYMTALGWKVVATY